MREPGPRPIMVNCATCGQPFRTKASKLAIGKGKYCSQKCYYHRTPEERFWEKVDKDGPLILESPCWVWKGTPWANGYGQFWDGSALVAAHRYGYRVQMGDFDPSLNVLHRCDNRSCIRGDHLFLGTHLDNMRDCVAKGRHADGFACRDQRGSANYQSKLTEDVVKEIRRRYAAGGLYQEVLAREFGISVPTVSNIVKRRTWRHV